MKPHTPRRPGPLLVVVALAALATLAVTPLLAGSPGTRLIGTVIEVVEDDKRFVLEEADGEPHRLFWNDDTAMLTRPRTGLQMRVFYVTDDDGRKLARRIGKAEKPSRR